ncbi:unknown protein [Seminavis robusta]|uniref:Uncharacterized protein n=1 Tax=Seminavis robusta TaxID=568900 RepID=A0A9N8F6B1_9STRA|nr:unknown protein [Seminavis robusta]|eukprot:Sro4197_g353360.1 n/a (290) ;mRNA; r:1635-2504
MTTIKYDPTQDFIHATLTSITGRPTRTGIKSLEKENKDNARQIHSLRGNDNEGHLRLCYNLDRFNARPAVAGTPWVDPVHPGTRPDVPDVATGPQITRMASAHKYDLTEFQLFQSTEKALLRKTMEAVEEVYYKSLQDPDEGYSTLSYNDLIVHLNEQYGTLTNDDLDKNIDRMNAKWTPTQPIEQLFHQINDARSFARDHDNITERATIRSALKNLENSGVFTLALKEWRNKAEDDQTWTNLQTFFAKANTERLRSITTKQAGFHDQHQANNANTNSSPYFVKDMAGY